MKIENTLAMFEKYGLSVTAHKNWRIMGGTSQVDVNITGENGEQIEGLFSFDDQFIIQKFGDFWVGWVFFVNRPVIVRKNTDLKTVAQAVVNYYKISKIVENDNEQLMELIYRFQLGGYYGEFIDETTIHIFKILGKDVLDFNDFHKLNEFETESSYTLKLSRQLYELSNNNTKTTKKFANIKELLSFFMSDIKNQ